MRGLSHLWCLRVCLVLACVLFVNRVGHAQTESRSEPSQAPVANSSAPAAGATSPDALPRVTCAATSTERTYCIGDTSAGVLLLKSNGPGECLLGRTWGYDQTGVWVTEGCSAEFAFGGGAPLVSTPPVPQVPQDANQPTPRIETWSEFDPGEGFLVA